MKHLLIILSILLLSSPVIGDNHKGETLYRWGENPPYKWMGFGDKETQPVYKGQVKDGKPDGLGIITSKSDGGKYIGEWKDGKRHGKGTFTWRGTGYKYVGEWKDDKFHGQGTLTRDDDGSIYSGGKFVGEFKGGYRWNGKEYNKNGTIQTITPPKKSTP